MMISTNSLKISKILSIGLPSEKGGKFKTSLFPILIVLSLFPLFANNPIEKDNKPLHIEGNKKRLTGFTFDCVSPTITGAFYASGIAQSGFVTLRISSVTGGATAIVVTNANGFSGGIASTTLTATQTSIQIPISFSGTSSTGTYTLNISSPNATNNCNVTVTVSPCSAYKPAITTNVPTTLCIGDSIKMTASSGTRYAWNTGETTASILKKTAGTYTVTVTSNGCTGVNSQTVSYNSNCEIGFCSGVLASNSYNITFGTGGRTNLASAVSGATTTHVYSPTGIIIDGQYAVTNNATEAGIWAANTSDHSGDGTTGRLMVINADNTPKECFRLPVSGLCPNLRYQFSAWIKSISNRPEQPNVTLEIRDAVTDSLLAVRGTSDIPFTGWIQYGLTFNTPANPNLIVVLRNNTKGGVNGNDLAIDDIQFAYCGPPVVLTMQGGAFDVSTGEGSACAGKLMTLKSDITPGYVRVPVYQWQESIDNGATWRDILGATSLNHTFTSDISFSDRKFKLLVAEAGKITTPRCRVESNVLSFKFLNGTGNITVTGSTTFCSGDSVVLTATNGLVYTWNTGENTASITKKAAGTYSVTITDGGSCVSTANKTVVVNPNPTVSIATVVNTNGTSTLTASAGVTYLWSTGERTAAISVNRAGNYTVTVTNSNGCSATSSKTIGNNKPPILTNGTPSVQEDIPLAGNVAPNASDLDGNLNPNSFSVTDVPKNGTIVMNPNGSFVYTPKPNFNGIDSVHYSVCDSTNTCTTATLIFNISAVNDAPTLTNARTTLLEDASLTSSVVLNANDIDGNLDVNSFAVTDNPLHGTITMNPNGSFVYTPKPNFNGVDSVHYKVCDVSGVCSSATLILTVTPVNDAPTLLNATPAFDEDLPYTSSVLPNAGDIDGNLNPNSFAVLNSPLHGTITMNPNGTYTYTPDLNFVGKDSVRYQVCDMNSVCTIAYIIFSISSVNDAPTLSNATPSVQEDVILTGSVSPNAKDVDNNLNPNSFTLLDSPQNGTIKMLPNGTYTYTPRADFYGVDSVHYQVCDLSGACVTATIIITVTPANDAPKAAITAPLVLEDLPVIFCGIVNDKDLGDIFNTRLCNMPKGSLNISINSNQLCIDYKPLKDFNGKDTICILVCDKGGLCDTVKIPINIIPINDPPSLVVNTLSVPADSTIAQCFLIADPDAQDGHSAFFCEAPKGTAQIKVENGNVCITYSTKFPNFENDTLCVILCDKAGACTQAYIPVTILPCADKTPPIINCPAPIEVSTLGTILSDSNGFIRQITLADNCNGVNLDFKIPTAIDDCSSPIVQQTSGLSSGGTFSKGLNVLSFETLDKSGKKAACRVDITVSTLQLIAVDNVSACINEMLNLQGKVLNLASYSWKGPQNINSTNPSLDFSPSNINQSGQYILSVTLGKNCVFKDTVNVNIHNAPKVFNDSFAIEMNGTLTDNVLKNDIVSNGLIYTLKTRDNTVNGTLNLKNDGSVTYQPTTGYTGIDKFTYEVCTDLCPNTCQKGTVVLTVGETDKKIYKGNEVITPNGDNFNETLIIEGLDANDAKNKSSIVIYSQWGELVFTAAPYKNNWKGTFKDLPLPDGTYYYIFKGEPKGEPLKSFITIFR